MENKHPSILPILTGQPDESVQFILSPIHPPDPRLSESGRLKHRIILVFCRINDYAHQYCSRRKYGYKAFQ